MHGCMDVLMYGCFVEVGPTHELAIDYLVEQSIPEASCPSFSVDGDAMTLCTSFVHPTAGRLNRESCKPESGVIFEESKNNWGRLLS
jgi:hypothetical protein